MTGAFVSSGLTAGSRPISWANADARLNQSSEATWRSCTTLLSSGAPSRLLPFSS